MPSIPQTQPGHGFSEHEFVNKAGGSWSLAQADAAGNLADAAVVEVIDANSFIVAFTGSVVYDSTGHGLGSAGDPLYLSQATPGAVQTSAPGSGIVAMVGFIIDANHYVVHTWAASE